MGAGLSTGDGTMSVLAATLLCDRKMEQQYIGPPAHAAVRGVDHYYLNIETARPDSWGPVHWSLPTTLETWSRSGWSGTQPQFDQDQRRLLYIVTARNMAVDFAQIGGYEWLLFLDADVLPQPDGLERLLATHKKLCGGLVPGRGVHSGSRYVYNEEGMSDGLIKCSHGTCGYMLIHRSIFEVLRFRFGPHQQQRQVMLSEDPAYCADARTLGLVDGFYIDPQTTAEHQGSLNPGQVAQF